MTSNLINHIGIIGVDIRRRLENVEKRLQEGRPGFKHIPSSLMYPLQKKECYKEAHEASEGRLPTIASQQFFHLLNDIARIDSRLFRKHKSKASLSTSISPSSMTSRKFQFPSKNNPQNDNPEQVCVFREIPTLKISAPQEIPAFELVETVRSSELSGRQSASSESAAESAYVSNTTQRASNTTERSGSGCSGCKVPLQNSLHSQLQAIGQKVQESPISSGMSLGSDASQNIERLKKKDFLSNMVVETTNNYMENYLHYQKNKTQEDESNGFKARTLANVVGSKIFVKVELENRMRKMVKNGNTRHHRHKSERNIESQLNLQVKMRDLLMERVMDLRDH